MLCSFNSSHAGRQAEKMPKLALCIIFALGLHSWHSIRTQLNLGGKRSEILKKNPRRS